MKVSDFTSSAWPAFGISSTDHKLEGSGPADTGPGKKFQKKNKKYMNESSGLYYKSFTIVMT